MRHSILAVLLLAAAASAQTAPHDVLSDSVRSALQIELRHMAETDQRVRSMYEFGTFSPCAADSIRQSLDGLPMDEQFAREQTLRAEAEARTNSVERDILRRMMNDADYAIQERLREIIAEHGWPSDERTGADVSPVVFLLHAPDRMDEMRDELMAEVRAGRLPAREFAMAIDKSRVVYGELQLYGTGNEFDSATQSVQPPRVADIDATNAARAAIGLDPLDAYREVASPGGR